MDDGAVEILAPALPLLVLLVIDFAAWLWGVDSRYMGTDPRTTGQPNRWI